MNRFSPGNALGSFLGSALGMAASDIGQEQEDQRCYNAQMSGMYRSAPTFTGLSLQQELNIARADHERKNNIRTILQEETDEWLKDALK